MSEYNDRHIDPQSRFSLLSWPVFGKMSRLANWAIYCIPTLTRHSTADDEEARNSRKLTFDKAQVLIKTHTS